MSAGIPRRRVPPPKPLSDYEREVLLSTDPAALTQEQQLRYLLAPHTGLTRKEKRALAAAIAGGTFSRSIDEEDRRRRVFPYPPRPQTVALRPIGFLAFAVLMTALALSIFAADVAIVVTTLNAVGTSDGKVDPLRVLVAAPVLGWFITLLGPAVLGVSLNVWTCFVRSLQPRFRGTAIAIIEPRGFTPVHRTTVTAVWRFLELCGWMPPLPLLVGAVVNGLGLLALELDLVVPAALLWAAGIVLAVIGVRKRLRKWKPKFDRLPTAA